MASDQIISTDVHVYVGIFDICGDVNKVALQGGYIYVIYHSFLALAIYLFNILNNESNTSYKLKLRNYGNVEISENRKIVLFFIVTF